MKLQKCKIFNLSKNIKIIYRYLRYFKECRWSCSYTGWFMKNVIHSGNWFFMSCWWKKFIRMRVRFSIVSEKTMYVFRNCMEPCEPRSVDLHSAWGKRALVSWYWGLPFLTGEYHSLACGLYSGLPDWAISRELGYPRAPLATDFDSWRFAKFWATTWKFDERILGEQQIVSSFVSPFV